MTYLIGIDEAGYGPNLGPLVISATCWQVSDAAAEADLYDTLSSGVARVPTSQDPRIAICDSKQLYAGGRGLDRLELGLLSALSVTPAGMPESWQQVWSVLGADVQERRKELPWYRDYERQLPIAVDRATLDTARQSFAATLQRQRVTLLEVRSATLLPRELNDLIEEHGSKGQALSAVSLALLAETLGPRYGKQPTLAICDKHGGRHRYGPLLQTAFPEALIEVGEEGRQQSCYRWGPTDGRVEVRFQTKGEAFLPTALASMASKYLRELAMQAFNAFWQLHVPGLKPTAGYPVDARRFRHEIAAEQQRLGIDDRSLWRQR